jgi:hypothetical protein
VALAAPVRNPQIPLISTDSLSGCFRSTPDGMTRQENKSVRICGICGFFEEHDQTELQGAGGVLSRD